MTHIFTWRRAAVVCLLFALVPPVRADLLDVYQSPNLTTPIGQTTTIDTAETGQQHYNFFSDSGHPSGVPLSKFDANVWVHQDTNNPGSYSFGFIFSQDNGGIPGTTSTTNFRIVDSLTPVFVAQSDDPGEAVEVVPGAFQGTFNYGNNTDGIMVSGISGNGWTIIIDSVDFGNITGWNAASGDGAHLPLTLGEEYRITPAGNRPSGAPADPNDPAIPIPEPTSLVIWSLLGAAGAGYGWRKRRR